MIRYLFILSGLVILVGALLTFAFILSSWHLQRQIWSKELERRYIRSHEEHPNDPTWMTNLAAMYYARMLRTSGADQQIWVQRCLGTLSKLFAICRFEQAGADPLEQAGIVAFEAGEFDAARLYADQLLKISVRLPAMARGAAVHDAQTLLGRLALRRGDVASAKRYLIESIAVPTNPSLMSGGPRLILAQDLLDRGEGEIVIRYLESCSAVWTFGRRKCRHWIQLIKNGKHLSFGHRV